MYHSISSVFMANKTCSGAEKHRKGTEPESSITTRMFSSFFFFESVFFFFLLSSDGLAQGYLDPSQWFKHDTAAFYME